MKSIYIKDLRENQSIQGETFAVKDVELKQTKNNTPYYRLTLLDKTGDVNGQIWADSFDQVQKSALKSGKVILIDAQVESYRGKLQLNISRVSQVDEAALDEYVEGSDFDLDELMKKLRQQIKKISNPNLLKLVERILKDKKYQDSFKVHPAAKYVHHSFRGGLLEHVVEMLEMLEPLQKYYPEADYDLVRAGIILHDIGKIDELVVNDTVVQRTKEGYLLGHLIKSYEVVLEFGKDVLSTEELINLKHIILSHHGLQEYGSPVIPATIEAAIVNALDEASSKIRIYQKVLRKSKTEDDFTEWDNILKTKLYKGTNDEEQQELRLI